MHDELSEPLQVEMFAASLRADSVTPLGRVTQFRVMVHPSGAAPTRIFTDVKL